MPATKDTSPRWNPGDLLPKRESIWPSRVTLREGLRRYHRLLTFVRPYWARLAVAAVVLLLNTLLGLVLPLLISRAVDGTLLSGDLATLNSVARTLLLIFAVQAVLGFGQSYLISWTGERVVANLRQTLYAHLHSMPLRFFSNTRVGELLSRLTADVTTVQEAVTSTLLSLLSQTVTLIGGVTIIAVMAWRLTLTMLAIVPMAVLIMLILGRLVRRISRQVQDALAAMTATAEEALGGVRIVKSFAREPYEIKRYGREVERLFDVAMSRVRVRAIAGPLIGLIAYSSISIVIWFGGQEVVQGRMTAGQLVSFLLYTMMVASPIGAFTGLYSQFQQALGASERIFEMLDTPPEMEDKPGALELPSIQGMVEFDHVGFDYGDSQTPHAVLRDVTLTARPGQVIALVGPSGAGKTTLVNLIPRFYDPTAGRILVDGHDIREVTLRSLREQIGIVPQEPTLFSSSVRENIRYGRLEASEEEIISAARAANAHEFVLQLPDGYDTEVGERGVKLSGGQRQRIAIARAILKNPRILILDEATSSLDTASEQAVQEALTRLMRDRTTFVIAHRLSTILSADVIAVLVDGSIVERGDHGSLVAKVDGYYRDMIRRQFRWDDELGLATAAYPDRSGTGF